MRYNVLGRTGLEVSRIGIGGIGTMGKYGSVSREEFAATMERASELRVNFLDTAPAYGDSEAVFGHYLNDHRQNWTVCTKIGQCGDTIATLFVLDQCEQSLRRLCVDYVDILLIHSIDQYGNGVLAVDQVRSNGMIDAMNELRRLGKVRHIGVSGQLPELIQAVDSGEFDVALTYNSFNLLVREAADILLPLAEEQRVGIVVGGPFYQGLLSGIAGQLV